MPRQLTAASLIAGITLRRRLRNRSFLVQAVLGPLLLATIISLAFGATGFDATIGIVDADGSPATAGFARGVTETDLEGLRFELVASPADARSRVADGELDAAVVVPAGFTASLGGDEPRAVEVLAHTDRPIAAEVARSVANDLRARVDAARLGTTAAIAAGGDAPSPDALADIDLPVEVVQRGSGGEVSLAAFFAPAMGLLVLFFSVGTLARDLLGERRTHLLDRVRAAPVHDASLLAGKALAVVVIGVVSLGTIWVATTVGLGARWGDPVGVALVIVGVALAVAGLSGLVAATARTEQQADMLASLFAFTFALIGGNFVGPGNLPPVLERLSLLTPNGWALQGFAELSVGGGSPVDVVPHLVVLVGWAVGAGALGAVLLRRRLGSGT